MVTSNLPTVVLPGQIITVQYTTNLVGGWRPLGVVTADFSGNFSFEASVPSGI